jgi:hypothetical protein
MGQAASALQVLELVARHMLASAGTDTPHDERVALYRAGTCLYLRLVALHLARQAGRIPEQTFTPQEPYDPTAARASIASDLQQMVRLLPDERVDRPGSAQNPREHPSLVRLGGGARGGDAPLDRRFQDVVLHDPSLFHTMSDAALEATNTNFSAGATLSRAYESLLTYAPSDDPGFTLQRSLDQAKRQGSFYTRPALARAVVESALLPIRDRFSTDAGPVRLLDPAMGTGVFLLEAVQALVRAGVGTATQVAEACLFGYDVDPLAVEVAVLSLWIETGARRAILARRLRQCDAVRDPSQVDAARFDVVVGNPPWGAAFTPADRKAFRVRTGLPSSESFDSFKLFLELAAERSTGTIAMIVPRAFLNGTMHSGTRDLLLRRFAPYEVSTLDAAEFPAAIAPACSLVFGPRPGPASIVQHVAAEKNRAPRPVRRIPARFWTRDRFPLNDGALLDLLDDLCRCHPRLGQVSHLYLARDAGINYNRASVGRRILYDGESPDHPGDLPRYRGRNFTRYGCVQQGGWVRHDAHLLLQPGERLYMSRETYELPQKVVFRQTADRVTATLDRSRMVMGRSVIAIVAVGDAPLLPLLACLNSKLFTRLYRALAGEEGRVLPQVKVKTISLVPLPSACLEGSNNRTWIQLGEMARRRLAEFGDCAQLDDEIDRAVYTLFGITASEIAALEAP